MYRLFAFARFYPYLALSVAYVLAQIGLHLRRKNSPSGVLCYSIAGFLILTSLAWLVFRGDIHSDEWVRSLAQN